MQRMMKSDVCFCGSGSKIEGGSASLYAFFIVIFLMRLFYSFFFMWFFVDEGPSIWEGGTDVVALVRFFDFLA